MDNNGPRYTPSVSHTYADMREVRIAAGLGGAAGHGLRMHTHMHDVCVAALSRTLRAGGGMRPSPPQPKTR